MGTVFGSLFLQGDPNIGGSIFWGSPMFVNPQFSSSHPFQSLDLLLVSREGGNEVPYISLKGYIQKGYGVPHSLIRYSPTVRGKLFQAGLAKAWNVKEETSPFLLTSGFQPHVANPSYALML